MKISKFGIMKKVFVNCFLFLSVGVFGMRNNVIFEYGIENFYQCCVKGIGIFKEYQGMVKKKIL